LRANTRWCSWRHQQKHRQMWRRHLLTQQSRSTKKSNREFSTLRTNQMESKSGHSMRATAVAAAAARAFPRPRMAPTDAVRNARRNHRAAAATQWVTPRCFAALIGLIGHPWFGCPRDGKCLVHSARCSRPGTLGGFSGLPKPGAPQTPPTRNLAFIGHLFSSRSRLISLDLSYFPLLHEL